MADQKSDNISWHASQVERRWRVVDARDGSEIKTIELGAYVGASPALRDGHAYVGTFGNQVLAVDLDEGSVLWSYENPTRKFPFYSSAAVGDELVVVGGGLAGPRQARE